MGRMPLPGAEFPGNQCPKGSLPWQTSRRKESKPQTLADSQHTPQPVCRGSRKLGRKAIKTDSRTLQLRKYLTPSLPPPPASADWTKHITTWGVMLNDTLGDCTIAGCAHAVQVWTANIGREVTVPNATIEKYYEKWDGYVPGEPSPTTAASSSTC